MNYPSILTYLYYLLIYADSEVKEKEIASIKQMNRLEGIAERDFQAQILMLSSRDKSAVFNEAVGAMKKLSKDQQIRIVAWLCVVANADGFMERTEWQFIYTIYHKELNLPLNEIFVVQKELNKLIWENPSFSVLDL